MSRRNLKQRDNVQNPYRNFHWGWKQPQGKRFRINYFSSGWELTLWVHHLSITIKQVQLEKLLNRCWKHGGVLFSTTRLIKKFHSSKNIINNIWKWFSTVCLGKNELHFESRRKNLKNVVMFRAWIVEERWGKNWILCSSSYYIDTIIKITSLRILISASASSLISVLVWLDVFEFKSCYWSCF